MHWATSEWLVQEIGLAIGRELELVILLENSVTPPGGMQGNVEYIGFERSNPERSFPALMQMLSSLAIQGEQPVSAPVAGPVDTDNQGEQQATANVASYDSIEDYEHAYLLGMLEQPPDVNAVEASFFASPFASSALARARWNARKEWWKQLLSQSGDLKQLGKLRAEFPQDPVIAVTEARILENLGEVSAAIASYRIAIDNADDNLSALRSLAASADLYLKQGKSQEVASIMDEARSLLPDKPTTEEERCFAVEFAPILSAAALLRLALKERALEVSSDDHDARFNLAYDYSEQNFDRMAMYHYENIPESKRTPVAWNNFGVAAERVKLKGLSIASYKEAESRGDTLAASNLANIMVRAGIFDEAERICRAAMMKEDCDANVGLSLSTLMKEQKEEKESFNKHIGSARIASGFMKEVGRAIASSKGGALAGRWSSSDGVFECSESGAEISFMGTARRPVSGLRRLTTMDSPKEETIQVAIKASRSGNALDAIMTRGQKDFASTILGGEPERKLIGAISEDGTLIRFLEIGAANGNNFFEFRRILSLAHDGSN